MPNNLRNGYALKLPSTNSMYFGINSVLFRACLLYNQPTLSLKQSQSLLEFKSKMKFCLHLHDMQDMILQLCIMNKYHCNYDI